MKYNLKITFVEPLLGSQPGAKSPASDFMRSKASEALAKDGKTAEAAELIDEEAKTLPVLMEKGTTGFHQQDGKPILYCYMIKGALKEAGAVLNGLHDVKQLRNKIEQCVYIEPRRIELHGERGEPLERPLRAQTAQGPRVTLVRSETMKPGAWFICTIEVLELPRWFPDEKFLRELLDHCKRLGFGQWRNSNLYGQFEYELTAAK